MIHTYRFPLILALSVVFGMPALRDLMMAPENLFRAGLSYLGALGLSWVGVNLILGLVEHYATHNARVLARAEAEMLAVHAAEVEAARAASEPPAPTGVDASGGDAPSPRPQPASASRPAPAASPGAPNVQRQGAPNVQPQGAPNVQPQGAPNVQPQDGGLAPASARLPQQAGV